MRNEHKHLANASKITIKKSKKSNATKFKLRTPRYLYTHTVNDRGHANKIIQSVPPFVKKYECKWAHMMLFVDKMVTLSGGLSQYERLAIQSSIWVDWVLQAKQLGTSHDLCKVWN